MGCFRVVVVVMAASLCSNRFEPAWANTISGSDEGMYGWIAINYLRGMLGKQPAAAAAAAAAGKGTAGGAAAGAALELPRALAGRKERMGGEVAATASGPGVDPLAVAQASSSGAAGAAGTPSGKVAVGAVAPAAGTGGATLGALDLGGSSLEVRASSQTAKCIAPTGHPAYYVVGGGAAHHRLLAHVLCCMCVREAAKKGQVEASYLHPSPLLPTTAAQHVQAPPPPRLGSACRPHS